MQDIVAYSVLTDRSRLAVLPTGEALVYRNKEGVPHLASRQYRVSDPDTIARKLEAHGFQDIQLSSKLMDARTHARSPFLCALTARYPGEASGGEYHDFVKFLLDNRGRAAFQVMAGALRMECANQFMGAPLRFRHTDPSIDRFLEEPWVAADMVRDQGRIMRERIESLRGVPGGAPILNRVRELHPKLGARAAEESWGYHWKDVGPYCAMTVWTALQGLTRVHANRLNGLAQLALVDGYEDLLRGQVPDCWPRPKAKAPIPYDQPLPTYPIN
jgi:hypothetical protein